MDKHPLTLPDHGFRTNDIVSFIMNEKRHIGRVMDHTKTRITVLVRTIGTTRRMNFIPSQLLKVQR